MTIYSNNFFEPDWNEIIENFTKLYTKIWDKDLQSKATEKIYKHFLNCVMRNAPNEAKELVYKLKDLT